MGAPVGVRSYPQALSRMSLLWVMLALRRALLREWAMGRTKKDERVVVVCGHPGCGKSQTVRRSRVTKCDGYMCKRDHGPGDRPPPGMVREVVWQAAGGFDGWRDIVLDAVQRAAFARAERLALFALAQGIPRAETDALASALVAPAGRGRRHLLTVTGAGVEGVGVEVSTGIGLTEDGRVEIEDVHAVALTVLLLRSKREGGAVLRTFTDETAYFTPKGTPVPVKELRGWFLADHMMHPLSSDEMREALTTDVESGTSILLERGVRPEAAWRVPWRSLPLGLDSGTDPTDSGKGA
ncbi:hypothetical protein GCM10009550_34890 [Actinocorallia libanotica]|uniref:Uncharacterized protein n=2 Tax=Actinocorallia libanotica TaxID=46162 RepID=A0ABN1R7Z6_9ACTN